VSLTLEAATTARVWGGGSAWRWRPVMQRIPSLCVH